MHQSEIERIIEQLQASLQQGWTEFRNSKAHAGLQCAFTALQEAGWYESILHENFPNPAYNAAAIAVGEHFCETARRLGISFDQPFPGNFRTSQEYPVGDIEHRTFRISPDHFQDEDTSIPLGTWKLTFAHCHEYLDFPEAPKLEIEK